MVRVNDGRSAPSTGVVEEVDYENRVEMSVSYPLRGRATPVELDFSQVEKLTQRSHKSGRFNRSKKREIGIQFRSLCLGLARNVP